jgi:predicted nuclease of predicted toxin-antitoxin system
VRIFLDENLPRKLVHVLRAEGHDVESVHTLQFQGLANGKLYEFARESFDLCFTRDSGFADSVRGAATSTRMRLLRVTLAQKPQDEFVLDFVAAFRKTDWGNLRNGDDWP